MYDDLRHSISLDDGTKQRVSVSRSVSPSRTPTPIDESISDLSQLKQNDINIRDAIIPPSVELQQKEY